MKKISSRFKVILGLVIGFNIIALIVLLIWITLNMQSALNNMGQP